MGRLRTAAILLLPATFGLACNLFTPAIVDEPVDTEGSRLAETELQQDPAADSTFQPEQIPDAQTGSASGFWSSAIDERTGLRFAVPCFWQVSIPSGEQDPSGSGSITVRNYDDAFVQAHPRGAIGEDEGAMKIDLTYIDLASLGLSRGADLSEFVDALAPPGDSIVEAIDPVAINDLAAVIVSQRNTYSEAVGKFAAVALQPDLYLVFGGAGAAFDSADVQAILHSISFSDPQLPELMPANPPLGVEAPCLKGEDRIAAEPLSGTMICDSPESSDALTFACGIQQALLARDLDTLLSFMSDPFTIGYWGSEGGWGSPADMIREFDHRLPADTARLTFTVDRANFPPLSGTPAELMFGPDLNVALLVYSEGWGTDGQGAAILYVVVNESGALQLGNLVYSHQHFDR
jgi:hypothetical protein